MGKADASSFRMVAAIPYRWWRRISLHWSRFFWATDHQVLLVTCLTARAVHLEVLPGLSADDVWTALRRLFALRTVLRLIYSDNGTCFTRVAKEIVELNAHLMQLSQSGKLPHTIQWRFSSPAAPHQGGVFERLVGIVKSHVPGTVESTKLSSEALSTIMAEVSAIVNSRPIGVLPDGTPLTPGHLIAGNRPLSWPALDCQLPNTLLASHGFYHARNNLLQRFWVAWRRSYLALLPDRFCVRSNFVSVNRYWLLTRLLPVANGRLVKS